MAAKAFDAAVITVPRGIVYEEIDGYIDGLANRGDAALRSVEKQGMEDGWPIVGAAEGSLLHILARSIRAKRILELGTAIGYSGTWLARALTDGGELVTVEHDPKTAAIARKSFEKTGVASKVTILVGAAQEVLAGVKGPFDFVFNDIDKAGYPAVLDPCIERVRVGGLLVTDNVLWHGDVARKDRSAETAAIRTYNERLAKDPRMLATIVPLRDGVSIALKIRD
ncbi:MAG: O-methyltransferase [Thermoplasmata archaeon]|nr:O-methyltransferase [Thermoplasmata archaeon]